MILVNVIAAVLVVLFLPPVENVDILFVAVTPSVSHQIVFQAVWKELSLRGHNVTVITPNPLNDPSLTNLTEIDINCLYDLQHPLVKWGQYVYYLPDILGVFVKDVLGTSFHNEVNEAAFKHKDVQKFLTESHHFDVAMVEWIFPTMASWGAKYGCPVIGITSLGAPIPSMDTVGNPSHPIYAPHIDLPVHNVMTFKERLVSFLFAGLGRIYYHLVVLPREDGLIRRYLGEELPYLGEIERNISVLLLNRNPVFHGNVPMVPAIIELGGIQLAKPKQTLNTDLKQFLDESKKGAIYFSLGSNMKSTYLPRMLIDIFLTVFIHLPYNIVWKWDDDELPGKPDNVFIQKWFPQNEVLAHPNVKLFMYQGGLQSSEDAIKNHVPVIGFPFFADQVHNVDTCKEHGMGIEMSFFGLTVEGLNSSIYRMMEDPSFAKNAAKLEKVMRDQPFDGLERAVWWTEYVIRHRGATHLRSPALDISWPKFLMLDVFGFLALVLTLVIYIPYKLIKLFIKALLWLFTSKKTKNKKKRE